MRLIWLSKIESGSTMTFEVDFNQSAKAILASRLAARNCARKPASSANGVSFRSCAESEIQPSPIASVMSRDKPGLACCSSAAA